MTKKEQDQQSQSLNQARYDIHLLKMNNLNNPEICGILDTAYAELDAIAKEPFNAEMAREMYCVIVDNIETNKLDFAESCLSTLIKTFGEEYRAIDEIKTGIMIQKLHNTLIIKKGSDGQ